MSRKTITMGELKKKLGTARTQSHIRRLNRKWNKGNLPSECENCGYHKFTELCHIVPVASFPDTATVGEINARENNVVLCPNCHKEFDHHLLTMEDIVHNSMVRDRSTVEE